MIVVDASLALRWFLDKDITREAAAALDYVGEQGGRVPGNFQSEIAHGLNQAERRGRVSATDVSAALSEILALPLTVELPDAHVVVATARDFGLTGYDAAYLALAMQSGVPLATVDEQLRKAARSAKALWGPRKR
ncbi:MAG TPA: type II toxin-antitoxin system VapC family toxin [Candidatus Baltobacteraceae bacterium]|nr:type II toxin-antitoxin system VapC family toxin [Candidatus Baltobacteraceae bacterium]